MKDSQEIADFIVDRIGHIYLRPLMYAGTPQCLDAILHYYHELWAAIFSQEEKYEAISTTIHAEEGCGSMDFSGAFSYDNPASSGQDIARYTVQQWSRISKELGMRVPHKQLTE